MSLKQILLGSEGQSAQSADDCQRRVIETMPDLNIETHSSDEIREHLRELIGKIIAGEVALISDSGAPQTGSAPVLMVSTSIFRQLISDVIECAASKRTSRTPASDLLVELPPLLENVDLPVDFSPPGKHGDNEISEIELK